MIDIKGKTLYEFFTTFLYVLDTDVLEIGSWRYENSKYVQGIEAAMVNSTRIIRCDENMVQPMFGGPLVRICEELQDEVTTLWRMEQQLLTLIAEV